MGFNRDVIRRRVDEMHAMGVRVRWAGRRPRLWRSVIKELEIAEEKTRHNDVLTSTMCVNYGGRAEIADAVRRDRPAGRRGQDQARTRSTSGRSPGTSTSRTCPTSTCSCAAPASSARRTSCSGSRAYAEMVFLDTLFPDFDRRHLWQAIEIYARRDRRFGGALDTPGEPRRDHVTHRRHAGRRPHGAGALPRRHRRRRRRADLRATAACPARCRAWSWTEGLPVLNLTCVVAWDLPARRRRARPGSALRRGRGAVRHASGHPRANAAGTSRCATRSRPPAWTRRRWARC